ncbi:ABC transporter substrate-binding protein [Cellulomonas bogoriensis]|uniref:ABC transporter substrate-binding protein n=1 Tax=Cellulomonas bogoriensis 69B4 = DSM 16987 TaxID=1386082 RepID=A0A0A0BZB1_9CELL|nr:ABC transporter substrate-binding protein [Cellulomonas bogoriensis]KGM13265.1 ABC transporter substrate-binding protein [Cellulomonas bogoriensis 69B4 = DSM 16987]
MKWTRSRPASLLAVGAASALLLTACGGDGDPEPGANGGGGNDNGGDGEVTLSIAFWGDFGLGPLVEQYEAENEGVTIRLNEGEFNAQHESLQQNLIAGSGAPDIAAIDGDYIVQFREQGDQFVNLLDMGAGDYEGEYLEWKWQQSMTGDGAQIGLGTDVGGLAMCYRHDLFEEAGLPSDRDEVSALWPTWEDFIEVGQEYVEATGDRFIDNATNVFNPIMGQQPVGYFTENEELAMDGGPRVAFDLTTQMIDAGISAGIPAWSDEWNAGFANGDFAVLACPAWMTGHIRNMAPDTAGQWDIADIPGGGGNWGGSWLTIPAQGDNTQAAYDFVEWLIQPEQQIAIFNNVGNLPSQPALYEDPAIQEHTDEFFNNAPTGQIFSATALGLEPQYIGRNAGPVRVEVENVLNDIQGGNVSAEEGWERAVSDAERAAMD